MTTPSTHLYKAIARSMLGRYAVYAANLISMMVLARVFTPEVFGVVAAIAVFYLFFQLMAEAGLGPAIINLKSLEPDDRNGLFGLTLLVGLIASVLFLAMAPLLLAFYQLPRVDEVVPYVAFSLLFFAASIIPGAFLQRERAFFRIANAGLAGELVSTAGSIILANFIDPLHALAAKTAFSAACVFLVQYYFAADTEFGRPAIGRKFEAIKPLLGFSGYQFGFNFINYFSRNLDNILIGKYLGAASLGVYDKAYQLMRYPLLLLTYAMAPAIQPVLREHAYDHQKVEAIHRDFTFKISLFGAVAGLAVYMTAELIVRLLLGPQWTAVVPIIEILSLAIPVQVVLSTSGSFFQTMKRTDLLFISGVLSAVMMVIAIVAGVYMRDVLLLSWLLVAAFHINFVQAYFIMYSRIYRQSMARFMFRMIPAAMVVIIMVVMKTV